MKGRIAAALLALCLCASLTPARASVTASLSATQIASGNTVQLTLSYDGLTTSEPNVAPLRRNFDILGTSSSTSVQIGTGGSAESTQVVLTLAPKRTGRVTIPSITWDGQHTPVLTLTVAGGGSSAGATPGAGTTAPASVYIVSRVTPAKPYVQAQVRLSVKIYTDERLARGSLNFSGNSAVLVKHVGHDEHGEAVHDGRTYQVITRRFVLFPLRSGRIRLKGPVLDAEVAVRQSTSPWSANPFSGFFGGLMQTVRPIEVHGDPIVLTVRPRPAGAAGRYWLPASDVTLTAQWSPQTLTAHAGDPLTVTLDLRAAGLTAAQLPDVAKLLGPPAGVNAYPDQAKLHNAAQGAGIVGNRHQTIAFIADHPGHYTLPAIKIRWWDTQTNRPRAATLPARTLNILPAAGAAAATPAPPVQASAPKPAGAAAKATHPHAARRAPQATAVFTPTLWQGLAAALAVLWLATLGGWFWSRRRRRPAAAAAPTPAPPVKRPDASAERTAFRTACARNDAPGARRHLLGWVAAAWNVSATSLTPLIAACRDPQLIEHLRALDRACYGGGSWQGEPLAQALRDLPTRPRTSPPGDDTLPPLYS